MKAKSKRQNAETPAASNGHAPVRAVPYARVSSEEQRTLVAYLRVSSEDQKRKATIETQRAVIADYCRRERLTLRKTYQDEAVSGVQPFYKRPGGGRLLKDANQKAFDTILVFAIDRMARDEEDFFVTSRMLKEDGVRIISVSEGIDTSDKEAGLLTGLRVLIAADERRKIKARTLPGMVRAAKEGRWPGGRVLYGYRLVEKRPAIHEEEAQVVKLMFRLAVQRKGLVPIAATLNSKGLHNRAGQPWRFPDIARLLHNPAFKGSIAWEKSGEKVTIPVPRIITEETRNKAQEALRLNSLSCKGNSKHDYLIKGLIRCDLCNRSMTGWATTGRRKIWRRYYRCTGGPSSPEKLTCQSAHVRAEQIESLAWQNLEHWIVSEDGLIRDLRQALQAHEEERALEKRRLATLHKELSSIAQKRDRLLSAYEAGIIDKTTLADRLDRLTTREPALKADIAELEQGISEINAQALAASFLREREQFKKDAQQGTISPERKRRIVERYVVEVRVHLSKGQTLDGVTIGAVGLYLPPLPQENGRHKRDVLSYLPPLPQENGRPSVTIACRVPVQPDAVIGSGLV